MEKLKQLFAVILIDVVSIFACTPNYKSAFFEAQGIFVGEKILDKTTGMIDW